MIDKSFFIDEFLYCLTVMSSVGCGPAICAMCIFTDIATELIAMW